MLEIVDTGGIIPDDKALISGGNFPAGARADEDAALPVAVDGMAAGGDDDHRLPQGPAARTAAAGDVVFEA